MLQIASEFLPIRRIVVQRFRNSREIAFLKLDSKVWRIEVSRDS